jgi:hypothetical protein
MLSHWLWTMVYYSEPVVVNHGEICWATGYESLCFMLSRVCWNHSVLCWASDCDSWCVMYNMNHNNRLSIANHDSQTAGSAYLTMIQIHLLRIPQHDSQPQDEKNHGLLCSACYCDSCCTMLSQRMRITMCYAEPLAVNHGVLFWASGCESWWDMLSHWLLHHDSHSLAQHSHRDFHPLAQYSTTWLTTTDTA